MTEKITDLDNFAVRNFYTPYAPHFPEGTKPPKTADDVLALMKSYANREAVEEAIGRARRIWGTYGERITFPNWIKHPLRDWLETYCFLPPIKGLPAQEREVITATCKTCDVEIAVWPSRTNRKNVPLHGLDRRCPICRTPDTLSQSRRLLTTHIPTGYLTEELEEEDQ